MAFAYLSILDLGHTLFLGTVSPFPPMIQFSKASLMTLLAQKEVANQEWIASGVTSHQGLQGPSTLWRPLAG